VSAHGPAGAPPVLLLHGLASNGSRYAEFCAHSSLRARHRLLRPDLAGHGAAITREAVSLARWCGDLEALLRAEGGGAAVVVGHSLGARVAVELAARRRVPVAGLVLVDPVCRPALKGRWWLLAQAAPAVALLAAAVRLGNRLGLQRGALPPLDLQLLDLQAREALKSPAAEAAFVRQYSSTRADLRHVPTAVYLADLAALFEPWPTLPPGLPVRVLLSEGATFADPALTQATLASPSTGFAALDCHHWPFTERPEAVRTQIDQWVTALQSA
jgi:esterase